MTKSLAVVMPAFNEEGRIGRYVEDLSSVLLRYSPTFVIVDDCSTDATATEVESISLVGAKVLLVRNGLNRGHGASTVIALREGLKVEAEIVLALDGDGQAKASDVANLVESFKVPADCLGEGVRTSRTDPYYRRFISSVTRWFVYAKSGVRVRDANTPVRIYSRDCLERIVNGLEIDTLVPNLQISIRVRREGLVPLQVPVRWTEPLSTGVDSSHWGRKSPIVPPRKLINFCLKAGMELVRL